jgi:phage terminase large subunit
VYGLDFGYNHPTALIRVYWSDGDIWIEPVIYESYLTTSELIEKFKQLEIEKTVDILADYSRPEIIAELQNAGYNVNNANKSVKMGINFVKTFGVICQEDEA